MGTLPPSLAKMTVILKSFFKVFKFTKFISRGTECKIINHYLTVVRDLVNPIKGGGGNNKPLLYCSRDLANPIKDGG